MVSRRGQWPPRKKPEYTVGIGHCAGEFFIGVEPPVDDELFSSIPGAISRIEGVKGSGYKSGATVLCLAGVTTEEELRGIGVSLTLKIHEELEGGAIFPASLVEMAPGTAPFQKPQPGH
jgi:hypothetical protein